MGFPALGPTYGLGSYNRTAASIALGGPRAARGNAKRIYAFYNKRGKGQAWLISSLQALNLPPNPYLKYTWRKFLL
jgi:hypothetical protein